MIDTVNQMLATQYRDAVVGLSQTDFWVLFNSEAGLRSGGNIDVEHKHSEGERGLLPLPSNVAFWNGSSAPDPNAPMPVETNVHHFMSYLGQLKNKSVRTEDGFTFYRGAFHEPKIRGNVLREARMLSGIVHGYLYFANFSDRKVPVESILNGQVDPRDHGQHDLRARGKIDPRQPREKHPGGGSDGVGLLHL